MSHHITLVKDNPLKTLDIHKYVPCFNTSSNPSRTHIEAWKCDASLSTFAKAIEYLEKTYPDHTSLVVPYCRFNIVVPIFKFKIFSTKILEARKVYGVEHIKMWK